MNRVAGLLASAALLFALLFAQPAPAVMGAVDPVPAATVLLPYFEVLTAPGAPAARYLRQTRMLLYNTSSSPVLAHVTLWTNAGVPTLGFDVYLPGYDMVDVNLRLAIEGVLPPTGPSVNAQGNLSTPPVSFPGCAAVLPPARLSAAEVDRLRAAHRGQALPGSPGQCAGVAMADDAYRGYATIDVVNRCSRAFPGDPASGSDPAYFVSGGTGIASDANVLWGEWWVDDPNPATGNTRFGGRLVAIEADPSLSAAGTYTFYGRRLAGSAADNRERLPAVWQARYISGGTATFDADVLVWRDPGTRSAFPCATPPSLRQREVTPFDEDANPLNLSSGSPAGYDTLLPLAAERIKVRSRFPSISTFAWPWGFLHLDLRFPASTTDPLFSRVNQAHVTSVETTEGRYSLATQGWPVEGLAGPFYPIP